MKTGGGIDLVETKRGVKIKANILVLPLISRRNRSHIVNLDEC